MKIPNSIIKNQNHWYFWGLSALLICLKLFQGDRSFFELHFAYYFENIDVLNWFKWLYHHMASLLLWFIVPVIFIKFFRKESLQLYGLKVGNWKLGLKATLITFLIMPIPVYLSSKNPEHLQWYPLTSLATASPWLFFLWGLSYLPHYIGWEFFFRGFLAFELKKTANEALGVLIPSILTVLMHIGKPQGETWGALLAGIYLGILTFRTGSVYYAVLFHFYVGMLNTYFCG